MKMDQINPNSEGCRYLYVGGGGANCAHTFFRVKVILRKFISLKFEASLKAHLNGSKLLHTYILSLVTGD